MLERQFYNLKASIALQKVSSECFRAFDVEEGDVFELNEVSFRILSLLADGHSSSEVVRLLKQEYDENEETIRHDVEELIQAAVDVGVLVSRT